jgi:hypothetical protein
MMQDPYHVPEHLIPPGSVYQWCTLNRDEYLIQEPSNNWTPVPFGRVSDHFPRGFNRDGEVVFQGMRLMQRPLVEVAVEREAVVTRAEKNVSDQLDKIRNIAAEHARSLGGELVDFDLNVKVSPR